MKRTQANTAIAALFIAISASTAAMAQSHPAEGDCFPACPTVETKAEAVATEAPAKTAAENNTPACAKQNTVQELAQSAEKLNDQIKPVKEIVGYVRSPQGLAIKLVNDHVVKIPAWVGYAVDPVGSLKSKAMDEVRTRAKSAIGLGKREACVSEAAEAPINVELLPLDTEKI